MSTWTDDPRHYDRPCSCIGPVFGPPRPVYRPDADTAAVANVPSGHWDRMARHFGLPITEACK